MDREAETSMKRKKQPGHITKRLIEQNYSFSEIDNNGRIEQKGERLSIPPDFRGKKNSDIAFLEATTPLHRKLKEEKREDGLTNSHPETYSNTSTKEEAIQRTPKKEEADQHYLQEMVKRNQDTNVLIVDGSDNRARNQHIPAEQRSKRDSTEVGNGNDNRLVTEPGANDWEEADIFASQEIEKLQAKIYQTEDPEQNEKKECQQIFLSPSAQDHMIETTKRKGRPQKKWDITNELPILLWRRRPYYCASRDSKGFTWTGRSLLDDWDCTEDGLAGPGFYWLCDPKRKRIDTGQILAAAAKSFDEHKCPLKSLQGTTTSKALAPFLPRNLRAVRSCQRTAGLSLILLNLNSPASGNGKGRKRTTTTTTTTTTATTTTNSRRSTANMRTRLDGQYWTTLSSKKRRKRRNRLYYGTDLCPATSFSNNNSNSDSNSSSGSSSSSMAV